jgi:hypothetical protein
MGDVNTLALLGVCENVKQKLKNLKDPNCIKPPLSKP